MTEFQDKSAFVTGGGSGIGRATALALASRGAFVAVADVDRSSADATCDAIRAEGGRAVAFGLDVTRPDEIETAFDSFETSIGCGVDILVNSAGVLIVGGAMDYAIEDWNRTLAINVTGTFACCQRAAKSMLKQGGGAIVNLSSISGARAGVGRVAYGTSKAAISALTRQFALELGVHNIRCNAIAPGALRTAMTDRVYTDETITFLEGAIPLKRLGSAEDVAAGVVFLAADTGQYISGETLVIDGGFSAAGILKTAQLSAH